MSVDERERATAELLPLARQLARGVAKLFPRMEFEELFADACYGIARALEKFDPSRGIPLKLFARRVISGAIYNGIRERDPVSEVARRTVREAERLRAQLTAERGESPELEELQQRLPALRNALTSTRRAASVCSLDAEGVVEQANVRDDGADPAAIVAERIDRESLLRLIGELPEKERKVLSLYYFVDLEPKAISEYLHLTVQRIYQLHRSALGNLRERIPAQP